MANSQVAQDIFQSKAQAIVADMITAGVSPDINTGVGAGGSPFVDFLMQLLTTLLPELLACLPVAAVPANAQALAVAIATKPGLLYGMRRLRIYNHIRSGLTSELQNQIGLQTHISCLKIFAATTVEDMTAAMGPSGGESK